MQIVTDYAADISPEQLDGLEVHYLPLMITIDGKTYRSGVDITHEEFYELQAKAKQIPTTSQPSPGVLRSSIAALQKRIRIYSLYTYLQVSAVQLMPPGSAQMRYQKPM